MIKDYLINDENLTERLRRFGHLFMCLLMFDLACTGSGRIISVGWFSPRIVLAICALLCTIPSLCKNYKTLLGKKQNLLLFILLFYLIFEAVRGKMAQNPSWIWNSDVMGFAWLSLIILLQLLAFDRKELKRLVCFGIAGASLQALVILFFNVYFTAIDREGLPAFWEQLVETGWGTVLAVEYHAVRVFCRSSMYMTVACIILTGRIMRQQKLPILPTGLFVLNFLGLFYTYTRSMYLSLLAGLLLSLGFLMFYYPIKRILLRTLLLAALFLAAVIGFDLVLHQGGFQYAVARCFQRDLQGMLQYPKTWPEEEPVNMESITENSGRTREFILEDLSEKIVQSPIIGHGLGASGDRKQTADEYFYHDMLVRCGIIGLLLYLAPAFWCLLRLWKSRKSPYSADEAGLYVAALIAFLIATYFNPWMNAAIGISWYAITLRGMELTGEEKNG